jgi:hypothetical protein
LEIVMSQNTATAGWPCPGLHPGTAQLWAFAYWQHAHPALHAARVAVFAKGRFRWVLHEYGDTTPILQIANVAPKLRGFVVREEPFYAVAAHLMRTGWTRLSDKPVESCHASP